MRILNMVFTIIIFIFNFAFILLTTLASLPVCPSPIPSPHSAILPRLDVGVGDSVESSSAMAVGQAQEELEATGWVGAQEDEGD